MNAMASQITSLMIVYSSVCSVIDQRKHQSFMSLAFVRGIHRWLVNTPHKGPVTRKTFPFDDVIMISWLPDNVDTLSAKLALCVGNPPITRPKWSRNAELWWFLLCYQKGRQVRSNLQIKIEVNTVFHHPVGWAIMATLHHYSDVIMGAMVFQINSLTNVYSTVYLGADQRKHQSSVSLVFVQGIHRDWWIPGTNGQ